MYVPCAQTKLFCKYLYIHEVKERETASSAYSYLAKKKSVLTLTKTL